MSQKSPTIVLITSRSDTGGGPKHVFELANYLKEKKINLVICSPQEEPYGRALKNLASRHIFTPHRRFSLKTLLKLIDLGKSNSNLIYHSHGRGAGIYTKILGLFGFKCIHTFHGAHPPKNLKEKAILLLEKFLGKTIKVFICVSPDERKNVISMGLSSTQNSEVIYNEFKVSVPLKSSAPQSFKVLGTLNRLELHKNVHRALELFSILSKLKPELKLLIGGDGPQRDDLELFCKRLKLDSKVLFLGNVENVDVFFESIDCMVSTSLGEGLPYTVLEAIERSVPCLLSNVPGHRFLQDNKYLFNLDSSDSFLQAFNLLEMDQQNVVKNRYKFVSETFNKQNSLYTLENLYSSIYFSI